MAELTGSSRSISIHSGFDIRAPGIKGEATVVEFTGAERLKALSRTVPPTSRMGALEAAIRNTDLQQKSEIDLKVNRGAPVGVQRALSGPRDEEVVELMVPAPPPGHDQVILSIDAQGAMTWHLPTAPHHRQQRFLIPTKRAAPIKPGPHADLQRSVFGDVARKLLKVFVYPITDPILGAIGEKFAEKWEEKNRPYGLRTFTPQDYKDAKGEAIDAPQFKRLSEGRVLLFIHGTFSTAHGAFFGLCDGVMAELDKRYHGRVFAFNHFTMSHDPMRNANWLLEQIPADCNLEVDIVCHSRGGLVARALAEQPSRLTVKRVVFAGVPNAGTLLADKDHMVQMIDRLTTVMNLFPTGPVVEFLEALITAVKVLGHAGLAGLPGLASMDPRGAFIRQINGNAAVNAIAYAVAADYQPTDAALQSLVLAKVADAIVDRIFENAANDLVVPQLGVFDKNGGMGFPIPPAQVLKIDKSAGVMHTTLFGHRPACDKILEWLTEA